MNIDTDQTPSDEETVQEPQKGATEPREAKEAAKYRRQLREAQEGNLTLTNKIESMQRREVERLAENRLAVPSDLWAVGGLSLAEVLDDNGDIDQGAVTAAIGELVAARPGLEPRAPSPDFRGGTREPITVGGATWGDVLSNRNRRH